MESHEGGCVCGSIRYRTLGEPARVTVCHCKWCQRRSGSGFSIAAVFDRPSVEFTLQPPKIYRHHSDESGRWIDQHFCLNCGTNIGFTLEWVAGVFGVHAGTFDEPGWIRRSRHPFKYIYMRSALDWSTPPEGAECYERHFRLES